LTHPEARGIDESDTAFRCQSKIARLSGRATLGAMLAARCPKRKSRFAWSAIMRKMPVAEVLAAPRAARRPPID